MSTSYSSKAGAKLIHMLAKLLSILESKSSTSHTTTQHKLANSSNMSRQHSSSPISRSKRNKPTMTTLSSSIIKNSNPIEFGSMCSMCFLDENKLKTCSRCLNRIFSKCSSMFHVDSNNKLNNDNNKCSMCVDKLYVDIKIGGRSSSSSSCCFCNYCCCRREEIKRPYWFSSKLSFRLNNDVHLANLCLFIFFASIAFLYKYQSLFE